MSTKKHFPILIEQDEDGIYIASCPSIQGCSSYGKTINEALQNIQEAIQASIGEIDLTSEGNTFVGFRDLEIAV
jgi:predicted RNase H-like HicB family nuclease